MNKITRCHFHRCHADVAFRVTQHNNNGVQPRTFYTCREHQHGKAVQGWTEPTGTVVRPWSLMGFTGTFTIEPLSNAS